MSEHVRPTARQMIIAMVCLALVLAGAFIGAQATRHDKLFSLSPPPPKDAPGTTQPPDLVEAQRLDLHRTFFTAWAALILVIPALCLYPFRRSSRTAAGYWLAFWTAAALAFAVHLYWAMIVIFDGDWGRISTSTRVSAAVIDTVFAVWWGLDVLLAWAVARENLLIRIQRAVVHLLAAVLFIAGSAIEGEIWLSRALGYVLAGAVVVSIVVALVRRVKGRTVAPAPA